MDFRFTPEQEAFRSQFISWLQKNYPEGYDPARFRNFHKIEDRAKAYKLFQRRLCEGGYAGQHYPKEYGGQGKGIMEEVIVMHTLSTLCPELKSAGVVTMGIALPTIAKCGTEEQKREFMPKIFNGTHIWCQGFSEPNAGSDMANIATRAVRKNGYYLVDGQKTWTSIAQVADYCILVVRTDPNTTKHKGLSYLLVDMKLPGIEIRPMTQITGEAEFNEVFFDNVRVPAEMRLGEEGQGWMIAITSLMFERTMGEVTQAAAYEQNVKKMIEMAGKVRRAGKPVIQDPLYRQQLAQACVEVLVLKQHAFRNLSRQLEGGVPGPEGSITKILWSEMNQRITENALGMQGMFSQVLAGSPWTVEENRWQYSYLRSKGNTIEAGTSEIQRNIIGERCLGLPKDVSRSARLNK